MVKRTFKIKGVTSYEEQEELHLMNNRNIISYASIDQKDHKKLQPRHRLRSSGQLKTEVEFDMLR